MSAANGRQALRLACIDSEAPPLFELSRDGGRTRGGFEPEAAALVAEEMGRELVWHIVPWAEMIPAVQRHEADAVWCGQGIIPARTELVSFTRPYAVFNESVVVRKGDPARSPEDLRGYRVAAISGSANLRLARTFPEVEIVEFASSDDVFADMLAAVREGRVDAMVDDDVVLVPLSGSPDFDLAFTARTRNPWGAGVAKDRPELLAELDGALARVIADGRLERVWRRWMPELPFPAEPLREGRPA